MTSHHLTIAKATFAASLLRPDVTKVNRDELPHFHHLLETAMLKCTPSNIQTCKPWLLNHIIPSRHRTTAFGKYLSSLSRYSANSDSNQGGTSNARQRLHLIYLVNDILHHVKYHDSDLASVSDTILAFGAVLPDLFRATASEQKKRLRIRLNDVVDVWRQEAYITKELLDQLRDSILDPTGTTTAPSVKEAQNVAGPKDHPYLMPSTHGDPSLPFYELPAGNFMPHIVPNKGTSMRPDSIRPLQFAGGPADEGLVSAVKDFLNDVAQIDDAFAMEDAGIIPDTDDLGQLSYHNEDGVKMGDTYYGWSRAFCEKMKARRNPNTNGSKTRSSSQSYSSSRSPSPPRKRMYSRSSSDRSRSRSRSRYKGRRFSEEQSSSRSPPAAPRSMQSIEPKPLPPNFPPGQYQQRAAPVSSGTSHYMNNHGSQFAPPPLLPGHMPVPPPRPPNWPAESPWPPAPPPPAPHMGVSGFPRPSFPPPPEFRGYQPGTAFPRNNGQPRYFGR